MTENDRPPVPPAVRGPGLRGAFTVRPRSVPVGSAAAFGLVMGAPILAGTLAGRADLGMLASMGAFAAPYARGVPYARRALGLAAAVVTLAAGMAAGTLAAGHPWAVVLTLALFAGLVTYGLGVVASGPPGALLLTLVAASATGLPVDPGAWPLRAGLTLAGGAFTWLVIMSGFPFGPRRPENDAVAAACRAVADLVDAVGTGRPDQPRHAAAQALDDARRTLGRPGHGTAHVRRLRAIVRRLDDLFAAAVNVRTDRPPPASMSATLRALGAAVDDPAAATGLNPGRVAGGASRTAGGSGRAPRPELGRLHRTVVATVRTARAARPDEPEGSGRTLRSALAGAASRHSLVLLSASRVAVCTAVALGVAYGAGLDRPYWVAISVCAVLQGQHLVATLQRAVNRAIGTAAGIVVAGLLLSTHPQGVALAVVVGVLQFVVELLVSRNYALAVTFITPLALVMVESAHPSESPWGVVGVRLLDTLIGCAVGLLGAYTLWRRASHRRLPAALSSAIQAEGRLLTAVFSGASRQDILRARRVTRSTLLNLRALYDRAQGDHPESQSLWPALIATERLGYLTLSLPDQPTPPDGDATAVRAWFGELAGAAREGRGPRKVGEEVPGVDVRIRNEILALARALSNLEVRGRASDSSGTGAADDLHGG